MATPEGQFPKTGNDPLYASEFNLLRPVMQVYTGNGFDSTATNTTDTQDHELTAITAAQCKSAGYVKIKITGTCVADVSSAAGVGSQVELKSQIKETGGAYGDIIAYKIVFHNQSNGASSESDATYTYEILATITAGMKTNGFQVKVFSQSTSDNAGSTATFTNIQTVQELA